MRQLLLRASRSRFLQERLPRYRFVRRAVRRFMPGEDADAALREAAALEERGMGSLLTLLGENVERPDEAREVRDHYLGVLDAVEERGLDAQLSVKPTQLGLDVGREVAAGHLEALAGRAAAAGTAVWIDMEASPYVDPTLELFRRARETADDVGVCLQAYLYRTERDLETLLPLRPRIRLVKGAYAEPPEIAHPKKRDVDEAYVRLAGRLLDAAAEGDAYPAFGTHDRALIGRLQAEAARRRVPPTAYEFEMLYGIGRETQVRLAEEGYRMRILISYGEAWYPWYVRRLAERPANVLFLARSLVSR